MKKLIITADDYGMSKAVNEAIDSGIAVGLITSTNVMTNMPYYQEACKLKNNPDLSVGIHWVLTCGKPVLSAEDIPTLVSQNGDFYPYSEFCKRYRKKLISNEDIKKELRAQYQRYVEIMGEPDYWNTHQNTHVNFKIYRLFVDMALELGIKKMRSHQRLYVKSSNGKQSTSLRWRLIEPVKAIMLNVWQGNAHKRGIASPDGVVVKMNSADSDKLGYVFANIKWKKNTIGEYVIHPATKQDSPYFGGIVEKRIKEYHDFSDHKTKELIESNGIELTTFGSAVLK